MQFVETPLAGAYLIEPSVFPDERGYFFESYQRSIFKKRGIDVDFAQDNQSFSKKGVLRGLHYQSQPMAQAKLLRVAVGEAFDVIVDIRPASPTFGRHFTTILSAENKRMLYVPTGFAHGFLALKDNTEFLYKTSNEYSPAHGKGILWNDPDLGIPWPKGIHPILSDKDTKNPRFKDIPWNTSTAPKPS